MGCFKELLDGFLVEERPPSVQSTLTITGAARGASVAISIVNNANEVANTDAKVEEKISAISGPCMDCGEPDPDCREQADKIKARRDELEERNNDLYNDKHHLYNDYPFESNPHPNDLGSWEGHVRQIKDKQKNLGRLISKFRQMGCPENCMVDDASKWLTRQPVEKPGK